MEIFGYDFDGVITCGIKPREISDVIITGRCIDEKEYVSKVLRKLGIENEVFYNPMFLKDRGNHTYLSRVYSGIHKVETIDKLLKNGIKVTRFFDDDEVQIKIIKESCSFDIEIVHILSNLIEY